MMRNTDAFIQSVWIEIQDLPVGSGWPDEKLLAIGRIFLSLHTLHACIRRDDEEDRRFRILHKTGEIFDECCRRCHGCTDLYRLGRFVPTLYKLATPCLIIPREERLSKCDRITGRLLDRWMESTSVRWEGEHNAMRSAMGIWGMLDETERKGDAAFLKCERILTGWLQTLSEKHGWKNISDMEALSRLELMSLASGHAAGSMGNDVISESYLHYKQRICHSGIPLKAQPLLLELEKTAGGSDGFDSPLLDKILNCTETAIGNKSAEQDEYWFLLSVLTECNCMKQTEADMQAVMPLPY